MKQVPLGVITKNENKGDEMVQIMEKLQEYVPTLSEKKEYIGAATTLCDATFHRVIMGGDHLTAERGRGAQRIWMNGRNPVLRLEGIETVALDWHAKLNVLEVREH